MQDKNQNPQEIDQQNEIGPLDRPKVTNVAIKVMKKDTGSEGCETEFTIETQTNHNNSYHYTVKLKISSSISYDIQDTNPDFSTDPKKIVYKDSGRAYANPNVTKIDVESKDNNGVIETDSQVGHVHEDTCS